MCGLFGYLSYGNKLKGSNEILHCLAVSSAERGTDATGIAYIMDKKLEIEKAPKSAYSFEIDVPRGTKAVMGHTRHSTQGSEKHIINNHPFKGRLNDKTMFALAHNGVISNDTLLRKQFKLPKTKIQTDSYIAVQLLEKKGSLSMKSLSYMAEQISGSFSFSILDEHNSLYIVKGDSPVSILHFKEQKTYVYASTEKLLWQALIHSPLFESLKKGEAIPVDIKDGQIIKIDAFGGISYGKFDYKDYSCENFRWWDFGIHEPQDDYTQDLKQTAAYLGYDKSRVDDLIQMGYSCDEIEEILYDPQYDMIGY